MSAQHPMRHTYRGYRVLVVGKHTLYTARIDTVAHLKALLVDEILLEEVGLARLKKLPTEAAPPHHRGALVRSLGTADADALEIESKALFSTDELKRKAEAARLRRVEAGVQDNVENMQPLAPPVFDQSLVGKKIEVCAREVR